MLGNDGVSAGDRWPELPLVEWEDTKATLQRFV